jgi:hypothetical protein
LPCLEYLLCELLIFFKFHFFGCFHVRVLRNRFHKVSYIPYIISTETTTTTTTISTTLHAWRINTTYQILGRFFPQAPLVLEAVQQTCPFEYK